MKAFNIEPFHFFLSSSLLLKSTLITDNQNIDNYFDMIFPNKIFFLTSRLFYPDHASKLDAIKTDLVKSDICGTNKSLEP